LVTDLHVRTRATVTKAMILDADERDGRHQRVGPGDLGRDTLGLFGWRRHAVWADQFSPAATSKW
jgi:hypothetical protein